MMLKGAKVFRKTRIIIGEPIYLDEYYDKKIGEQEIKELDEKLRNKMLLLQDELFKITEKGRRKKKK